MWLPPKGWVGVTAQLRNFVDAVLTHHITCVHCTGCTSTLQPCVSQIHSDLSGHERSCLTTVHRYAYALDSLNTASNNQQLLQAAISLASCHQHLWLAHTNIAVPISTYWQSFAYRCLCLHFHMIRPSRPKPASYGYLTNCTNEDRFQAVSTRCSWANKRLNTLDYLVSSTYYYT